MDWETFRATRGSRSRPIVVGHRGAPQHEPENTLRSFRRALAAGVDVLETDLRFTSDGEIVLIHDATLERTTDGCGPVSACALAEIKRLRTRHPNGKLVDERVPTLIDLLAATQAQTPLLLELKDARFGERRFAGKLVELLAAYDLIDLCAVVSFDAKLVTAVKAVEPRLPIGFITLSRPFPPPAQELQLLGPFWPLLLINPFYVAWAHRQGRIVAPLDPNPAPRLRLYRWLGVDALLADDPAGVLAALQFAA